jgi:hypothetical protein
MTAVNIPDLLAKLKAAEVALGDALDIPRSSRAFEAYWKARRTRSPPRSPR